MFLHSGTPAGEDGAAGAKHSYSEIRKQLFLLGLFPLSEHIAWSSIFPYIYGMVQSLSSSTDPEGHNTAFYAGLLVSAFTFGEFLMAPQWAKISDRIGRKPTLLIGSVGAMFSAAAFGLSISLPMAIGARICAGMLNPNLGILKTYVGELVSKDKQARGFSAISFMRGFGSISGPIIGGYLADPTRKMPSIFPAGSLWDRFPYLLPNLVVVVCLTTSCTCGFFYLQEVHPHFRNREDIAHKVCAGLCKRLRGKKRSDGQGSYAPVSSHDDIDLGDGDVVDGHKTNSSSIMWLNAFTKQVVLQILSATFLGFLKIATLALVPVFLGTPQPSTGFTTKHVLGGGFGLNTQNTSNLLLTQAIASIFCQMFLIPRFIERLGALRSYRITLILWITIYCLMPLSITLPGVVGRLVFMVLLWIHTFCSATSGTCTSMMITNTAPSPIYLATINGVAASCSCLARAAGPATTGALFRLGLDAGNVGVPFWTLGIVAVITLGLTGTLQEHREGNA